MPPRRFAVRDRPRRLPEPSAAADALDESGRDTVALDRQRMIGVRDAGVVETLEVRLAIAGRARRCREAFDDRFAHFLPELS